MVRPVKKVNFNFERQIRINDKRGGKLISLTSFYAAECSAVFIFRFFMIEQLPIVITASAELVITLPKINAVKNRLAAQFNFQTMTANWYGDEKKSVFIHLQLQTATGFSELLLQYQQQVSFSHFSDDVISVFEEKSKQLHCMVAITTNELALLSAQEKLLTPYLQKKLYKVLNLIAGQLKLAALTPLSGR